MSRTYKTYGQTGRKTEGRTDGWTDGRSG